ncbi:MAG: alpha/beta fold hydrolase [Actinobacteria bacterium]|nr:alpha/beta fold hydrolase [Actinomycetota bacterium]
MTDGLLLLHAFPLDSTMWEPQVSALSGKIIVVAPNFPGFGGGTTPPETTEMEAAAAVAEAALTDAGVERAVVCGLSMGGYAALAFWRGNPDRTAGLVLANTRAGADDEAGKDRRRALARRLRQEGSEFLVEDPPPLLSANAPPELWSRVKDIIRAQSAEAIAAASLGMAARPDFTDLLNEIRVPTLVITSTGDTLIPPDASRPLAEAIPGAALETIEGAGHLSSLEAPEAFNRLLRGHLATCGVLSG